jgi:hypothetical protein
MQIDEKCNESNNTYVTKIEKMEPSISLGQSHSPITRVIKIIIQLVQYNINGVNRSVSCFHHCCSCP